MLVEEMMTKHVQTLLPSDTLETACKMIMDKDIRHVPIVTAEGEVVGMLSDRDIRDAMPSIFATDFSLEVFQTSIETIMTQDIITCHPLDWVEEVSTIFFEHKIGCLPVVNNGKLVGLITGSDCLRVLLTLTGVHTPSSRVEIKVRDEHGMLNKVTEIFSKRNINIVSVLVYPYQQDNYKVLVVRFQALNPLPVIDDLKQEGYKVRWMNMMEDFHD